MKIIHIIPGSGGNFYCGNCLRDSKYVDALRNLGHQVVKIPMYLPLFSDEHDIKDIPVFYGAVSIYLKQLYPIFRKAPAWFDNLLNSKPILKLAAGRSGSTRAKGLEELTISMLLGEEGKQKEELDRMIDWIAKNCNPEIIHLSNALLLGLARRLKEKLNTTVICSLQDEDVWVDVMEPEIRDQIWKLMHDQAQHVDGFIAVSNYYGNLMMKKMDLPAQKIENIHLGVNPDDYRYINSVEKSRTIGFLSRMNFNNGLDILVDAFILLKQSDEFKDVKLVITGGSTGDDSDTMNSVKKKLKDSGLRHEVDFHANFEGEARIEFFNKVSVLSVPVRSEKAFGLYLIEAMASGIPVIQPDHGAFPEIINLIDGGICYQPNSVESLHETLKKVLRDKDLLEQKSHNGYEGIKKHFHIKTQSEKMIAFYQKTIQAASNEYI